MSEELAAGLGPQVGDVIDDPGGTLTGGVIDRLIVDGFEGDNIVCEVVRHDGGRTQFVVGRAILVADGPGRWRVEMPFLFERREIA